MTDEPYIPQNRNQPEDSSNADGSSEPSNSNNELNFSETPSLDTTLAADDDYGTASLVDGAPADGKSPTIGPYNLLQKIGEGGMASKEVINRFEAERQALAMIDHQQIV